MKRLIIILCLFFFSAAAFLKSDSGEKDFLSQAAALKELFQYQQAIEVLERSGRQDDPLVVSYLARLFYLSGESDKAFKLIYSIAEKDWRDYLYLGLSAEDLGYIEKAVNAYQSSLNLRKNSPALMRLGKIYRQKKDWTQAVAFFRELTNYDSSIRIAHYYLGQSFNELGRAEEAYRYLSRTVNFYPHSKEARKQLEKARDALGKDFFVEQRRLREKRRREVALSSYKEEKEAPLVRIGIAFGLDRFSFRSSSNFQIRSGDSSYQADSNTFYTLKAKGGELFLLDRESGQKYSSFSSEAEIIPLKSGKRVHPFYVLDVVYGRKDFWHTVIDRGYRGSLKAFLKDGQIVLVNILSVEEYLYGVLAAEIPPRSGKEALRAQAILARSLVLRGRGRHQGEGFDFCADIHCQVYHGMSAETKTTINAVDATRGEVVTYEGEIPEIFYHSNCGGCLSADVFGQKNYLASGPDSKDESLPYSAYGKEMWFVDYPNSFCASGRPNFRWQRIYDSEDFQLVFGLGLEDFEGIDARQREGCFRYSRINALWKQKTVSLESGLRIRNYFDRLRSSAFRVELKKKGLNQPNMLIFWGAGFGHGSGLCQEGAMGMADSGYTYKEILSHYYPKAVLEKRY